MHVKPPLFNNIITLYIFYPNLLIPMHFQLKNATLQVWMFSMTQIQNSFTRMHFSFAIAYNMSILILKCCNWSCRETRKLWKGEGKVIFRGCDLHDNFICGSNLDRKESWPGEKITESLIFICLDFGLGVCNSLTRKAHPWPIPGLKIRLHWTMGLHWNIMEKNKFNKNKYIIYHA